MKLQNYPSAMVIAILTLMSTCTSTPQARGEVFLDASKSLERNSGMGRDLASPSLFLLIFSI